DPYEAIRQPYLVGTDTETEPIEDPVKTEAPESPHTVASPISLPDSTPPICHDEELEGSDMSGARFTSSDSIAPLSPNHPLTHTTPTLVPGTSELVEDDDEEGDDEEMEESLDSDSVSEGAEDESPTTEDEDPAAGDKGLTAGDEGPGMGVESLSLGGDEAVSGVQQRAYPIVETAVGEPLGLGYKALRRREIALGEGRMPSVFEVGQSSRVVLESKRPEIVSAFRHPTLTTWMKPEDGIVYIDVLAYPPPTPPAQTPPSPEWSSGSLPISPVKRMHKEQLCGMPLVIRKERRARLELAEVVDSMRRGQEPRGDV
ncbi:hypothetical protein Tco_1164119, partial [Tanacetum coccineum]